MIVIGLCGGSGSGKGTVSTLFEELGIPSVDTDAVYRELTCRPSECLSALASEFGNEIISADGSLNRKALADLVFSGDDADKRRIRLNLISHKFILDETRSRLKKYEYGGFPAAIVDAPVLFESGFDGECSLIVCVLADRKLRLSRIMARDNIDLTAAERRIDSQLPDDELISRSDFVIYNNGDTDELRGSVASVANKILKNN